MLGKIDSPDALRKLDPRDLPALCDEIREVLIETVLRQGGHLASNLGAVELQVAMHYAFHAPQDKLLFDVGHQAYVHKLLTGRRERFAKLRQRGGISGFPRIAESEYDAFSAGHASTAISAGLGMARARDIMGDTYHVAALVGDGALTGGLCYEALNDAGQSGTRMIVILNDNEMSISANVGALARHLTALRQNKLYHAVKRGVKRGLEKIPLVGGPIGHAIERLKDGIRRMLVSDQFFDALGFEYYGPIDGHDVRHLIRVMNRAKSARRPVLLHVVTQKGRGYQKAERQPDRFHGVSPAFVESSRVEEGAVPNGAVVAAELIELADKDIRVVALTAAMPGGTGLEAFGRRFPDRMRDVGIAEEHMITTAAGMAAAGLRPYVGIYSTFLQRGYDQMLHDVCLQGLPVTLLIDRAGLVGEDGMTHQGIYDLCYLRHMPGLTIASARDVRDLKRLIQLSIEMDGPMAIRYAKDGVDMGGAMTSKEPIQLGQWERMTVGQDVSILAVGRMVQTALRASIELMPYNISCAVVDARFIKPMDEALLREEAERHPLLVTLEDNALAGGFGSAVLERLSAWQCPTPVLRLGVPDRVIEFGTVAEQMQECGMDVDSVVRKIREAHAQRGKRA